MVCNKVCYYCLLFCCFLVLLSVATGLMVLYLIAGRFHLFLCLYVLIINGIMCRFFRYVIELLLVRDVD